MLKINTALFITSLVCFISATKTIANQREFTRSNYEKIYRLKLDWATQDLNKYSGQLNRLYRSLDFELTKKKDAIEQLKQAKFLSYHINKHFRSVYTERPRYGKPIIDIEPLRLSLAYSFFPITLPLTTIAALTEWIYSEKNDAKIAEKILQKDTFISNIEKIQRTIKNEIAAIDQQIAAIETEQNELKQLDTFIAGYNKDHGKHIAAIEHFIDVIDSKVQDIEKEAQLLLSKTE